MNGVFGHGVLWAAWAVVALLVLGYAWLCNALFRWTLPRKSAR
jgi:hypothetical protein